MTQSSLFTRLLCTGAVGLLGLTAFGNDQTPAARGSSGISSSAVAPATHLKAEASKLTKPANPMLKETGGPGPRGTNDNCADAIQINCGDTITGNTAGNTTDFVWPCAAGGSEQWYTVVASDTTLVLDLCGSSYDTAVMVLDGCGGPVRGCNDDSCGLQSQLTVGGLTVGNTYWIAVGGFNGATGSFTMTVTCSTPPPCDAANPQPGDVEESEPFGGCDTGYTDSFNGGCNSIPPAFSPLTCGQTVHGESGTFLSSTGAQYRDTDWYQFEVTGTGAIVTWSATADFPALIGILREGCPTGGFLVFATAPTCTPVSVVSACLPPGNYYAFIAPSTFSGIACGSEYRATLDCVSCEPPPSCAQAQPGDVEESEPFGGCDTDYADAFNGGCNSNPPAFSPIDCGDTVHGESGTFPAFGFQYRDTDWWLVTVGGTGAILNWTVTADFPVLIGFVAQPCPQTAFLNFATAPACTEVSVVSACLPPGEYVAFVAPSAFTGVPCGSQYRGTLTCTPCEPPPPPANDDCGGAIQINCGDTIFTDNISATNDGLIPSCSFGGAPTNSDVWYSFVAAQTGATISLCGGGSLTDTVVSVYDGCGGAEIACNDDFCGLISQTNVSGLTLGNTYYIRVAGWNAAAQGSFSLALTCNEPVGNDTCGGAIAVNCGDTVTGDTTGAGTDMAWNCAAGGAELFYSYVAAAPTLDISLCGSSYDTAVQVMDGCPGNIIGCNDDSCGLQSQLNLTGLTVGQTYYIAVGGFASNTGAFTMTLSNCAPTGACCVSDSCTVTTEANCASQGGSYQGDGTDCGGISYVPSTCSEALEDISATGTLAATASNCDDCFESIAMPFNFTFYGNTYSSVNVASNGYLQFGTGSSTFTNVAIPNPAAPNNIVCPFWDDWNTLAGGDIYYEARTSPSRFIVQWHRVFHFGTTSGENTFQAILYADGSIDLRQGDMNAAFANTGTIGIENADGTAAISFGASPNDPGVDGACFHVETESTNNPCEATCLGDLDNDGDRDISDLAILLSQFGSTGGTFAGDIDGDGDVDIGDLAQLLSVFGVPC